MATVKMVPRYCPPFLGGAPNTANRAAQVLLAGLLLVILGLAGCANSSYTPVVDCDIFRSRTVTSQPKGFDALPANRVHVVKRGETLYSIAWRYGLDVPALARANGIGARYTIYPEQRLTLNTTVAASSRPATSKAPAGSSTTRSTTTTGSAPASSTSRSSAPSGTGSVRWHWPHDGGIIGRFNAGALGNKGILIAGKQGDPVKAAADGVVVYRGSGMTGYGNLLIVKHNDEWLSAYAHNDKMLVSEGTQVKAGQAIAAMGDTGTSRTQLHFEIRRNGTPVNPQTLLPGR